VLSQVLMACTYPLEIVQADRWLDQNKSLKGDALAVALEKQTWDASVKSLVNFPQVLKMLDEKIERTIKLGDAFLADQKRVMDTVQKLRGKAQEAGNLKSSSEQTVTVDNSGGTQVIVIQPTNPEVIYVPTYNPTVVYGTWWYPSYPPYYYYPPGYVARPGLWFGAGVAVGVAWGYAWGNCNWHGGDVNIDIDRNTNINRNIDRDRVRNDMATRDRAQANGKGNWQHDPSHRQGVAYRDQGVAQRYGGQTAAQGAQARQAYRGRTDTGIQNTQRPAAGAGQTARPSNLPSQTGQNRANTYNQTSNNYSRDTTGMRSNTFDGANSSGAAARNYSQQGQTSRSSAARSSGAARPSGGGASRAGGGGRRR
jgi:hypothetical protein